MQVVKYAKINANEDRMTTLGIPNLMVALYFETTRNKRGLSILISL
jgi:hypothetical protein